jgi:hypothetical protein
MTRWQGKTAHNNSLSISNGHAWAAMPAKLDESVTSWNAPASIEMYTLPDGTSVTGKVIVTIEPTMFTYEDTAATELNT